MRLVPTDFWRLWSQGGPFIGDAGAPHARVTVEPSYRLRESATTAVGSFARGPIRWFQRQDNSQTEFEVPNIQSIQTERSLDADAASCNITLKNQWMRINTDAISPDDGELGQPGYFTFSRGESPDAQARWGHETIGDTTLWYETAYPDSSWTIGHVIGSSAVNSPPNWPDAITSIIWDSRGTAIAAPPGQLFWRYHFTLASPKTVRFYAAVDDYMKLYVDGELKVSEIEGHNVVTGGGGLSISTVVDMSLAAGSHCIAIQGVNHNQYPDYGNPGALLFVMYERIGTTLGPRMFGTDDVANWKLLPYQATEPPPVISGWNEILVPNALIRTYQGYGGKDKSIAQALTDGNIILTGVWLVDSVRINASDNSITLACRDMAKLLIEQQVYPPLVPLIYYPLRYARYILGAEFTPDNAPQFYDLKVKLKSSNYIQASSDAIAGPNGPIHGHVPYDSDTSRFGSPGYEGGRGIDPNKYWLSEGYSSANPATGPWFEVLCREDIDAVYVRPWAGNYQCFVSVFEVDATSFTDIGAGMVDGIPYVAQFGTPWETQAWYRLGRVYRPNVIRFTFKNLVPSPWDAPNNYRVGIRGFAVALSDDAIANSKRDGNYKDYSDIVKDLLLWGGFWFYNPVLANNERPPVYGSIESTGAWADDVIPEDNFDKRPLIDGINFFKEIVGYVFNVDETGAANFRSPNWWSLGNFFEDGTRTNFMPEIDERLQLTNYTIEVSDKAARSEIIIGTADPTAGFQDTITSRYVPPNQDLLKGMVRPAMWNNGVFTNKAEQEIMARLIALHSWFAQRQGSVTCVANPAIQIDDQVRIYERQTGETYVHYVRGISTQFDVEQGNYTMTLTTNWLGERDNWAIQLSDSATTFGD